VDGDPRILQQIPMLSAGSYLNECYTTVCTPLQALLLVMCGRWTATHHTVDTATIIWQSSSWYLSVRVLFHRMLNSAGTAAGDVWEVDGDPRILLHGQPGQPSCCATNRRYPHVFASVASGGKVAVWNAATHVVRM
jgi:hypothetical protein